jgi:hypothetical protein
MVKFLLQYHIDWLCVPTTKASEMCCPECLAPLVVGDVLNVILPPRNIGEYFEQERDVIQSYIDEINNAATRLIASIPEENLNEDQRTAVQEAKFKVEQLKTSIPDTVIPEPDNPNIIPGGEPSDLTTPFTSDGNPTPATEEADRVAKEASVAANKVLDKGIIDGKPDNEIINDMAAAVNKVIDDSLKDAIPAFICDVCGKECKNQFGLNSHKKSHKGGK